MADQHNIGCTCGCRIGLEVVQPESIGLQLEQFHIGFEDVPTLVISGGGTKAIEQWWLMIESLGLSYITDAEIEAECEAQWENINAPAHDTETMAVVQVEKNGSIMEDFWSIPNQLIIESVSSTKITNTLTDIWSALNA